MSDVYKRLAKKLDELPQGFPATETGVELKILKKIFLPEDAEVALKLRPVPEIADILAERLGKSTADMRTILDNMAEKCQIGSVTLGGQQRYMLAPFLPGIWEFQVYRLDKELTGLFEEYFPTLIQTVGGHKPGIARTVPVNRSITADSRIQRYEDVRAMIERAKPFKVMECICRKERALEKHSCDHSLENCLSFSTEENAYDYFSLGGRIISKEEALEVLEKAGEEGLVHNAFYNTKQSHFSVCNCCPCCCAVLRGFKEFSAHHMMAKSDFVAVIDQETCSQCGVCAEERCPMDAIAEEDDTYSVAPERCIGCGVCMVTCPTESIKLVRKPESEQEEPAENMADWARKRSANRGLELKP